METPALLTCLHAPPAAVWAMAATAVLLTYLYIQLLPKPIPGIPRTRLSTLQPLGNAPSMLLHVQKSHDLASWCALQNKRLNAPLVQVFIRPLSPPWLLLSNFAESQDILLRRTREFDRSDFISDGLAFLGGAHSRSKTDDKWKASRAWVQDLMTTKFLNEGAGPRAHAVAERLMETWRVKACLADGRPFEAGRDLMYFALDAMLGFTFGDGAVYSALGPQLEDLRRRSKDGRAPEGEVDQPVPFDAVPLDPLLRACEDTCEIVEHMINAWLPTPTMWYLKLREGERVRRMLAAKETMVREQIQIAMQQSATPHCAVELMVARERKAARDQGREPAYFHPDLVDEIYNQLLSGFHTTGSALGWVVKHLTANDAAQTKLREEFDTNPAFAVARQECRHPQFDELRQADLPYLDAVIQETLRLYGNFVTRTATQDTTVLGHFVPKGTLLFLLSGAPALAARTSSPLKDQKQSPHRLSTEDELSRHLSEFHPERWLREDGTFDAHAWPLLTFGGGPRGCFGRRLAYLEMRIVTALLVWNFDLLKVPGELAGMAAQGGIAFKARECFVTLRPRDR